MDGSRITYLESSVEAQMANWYRWFRVGMKVLQVVEIALAIIMVIWPGLLA